jgi:YhcH/YjgK/YiaL family protein
MYEAHNKYIDIQIVLDGEEKIYYKNKDKISYPQQFDEKRDIGFYNEMITEEHAFVKLDGSNFAIIYPHEGHAPQVQSGDKTTRVKKTVVKLPA